MLELKSISYTVREGDSELGILKDISLTIDDHKLVVFTGPNGGGKTTLAKIIMGLVKPTSGQILWNGQDITDLGITERARLGISYGLEVTKVSNGRLKERGVSKGFIILRINNQNVRSVSDIEQIFRSAQSSDEQTMWIWGKTQAGRQMSFAISLGE